MLLHLLIYKIKSQLLMNLKFITEKSKKEGERERLSRVDTSECVFLMFPTHTRTQVSFEFILFANANFKYIFCVFVSICFFYSFICLFIFDLKQQQQQYSSIRFNATTVPLFSKHILLYLSILLLCQ